MTYFYVTPSATEYATKQEAIDAARDLISSTRNDNDIVQVLTFDAGDNNKSVSTSVQAETCSEADLEDTIERLKQTYFEYFCPNIMAIELEDRIVTSGTTPVQDTNSNPPEDVEPTSFKVWYDYEMWKNEFLS